MNLLCQFLLTAIITFIYCGASQSQYSGSQAYNHLQYMNASVNIATGTFHLSYPLIKTAGIHNPFTIKLNYRFNAHGMFGLPKGWQLDLDHINNGVAEIGGQWLIDPMWHDETLFASGLKYCNQHGSHFQDNLEEELIPNEDSLYYRYRSRHKDGIVKYFSHQGLLVLQTDRFGNKITLEYEQPVQTIATAKLAAVIDNYGNRYTFSYAPGSLTVHYPDARQQTVFFNPKGVTAIINPLKQRYDFKYFNYYGHNLIKTVLSPSGLISQLSYGTIPFKNEWGAGVLPVVTHYIQADVADKKIHYETHYNYTQENNYTGYPLYSMSQSSDSLMESNDETYRYKVEVKQIDNSQSTAQVHHKIFYYNYLHLPVEVHTLKNEKAFLKIDYTYVITPFKYSRSTNYDKPASTVHSTWSEKEASHIPSNRIDQDYDLFGNKTHESHWVYDRPKKKWLQLKKAEHKYYTAYYSLLAESIHKDFVSGMAIKEEYLLSRAKKTHSAKLTYGMQSGKVTVWQPWQQQFYCYDKLGRVIFGQLKWLAKGMPGIQRTNKRIRYFFDNNTGTLTTQLVSSTGRVTQSLMDTRNNRVHTRIFANGERVGFRYNALGQLTEKIDPEGYVHKIHHYSYGEDGVNAKVIETPLGYKKRYTLDASERPVMAEEWVNGKYRKIGTKEFNAFGKVIISKNKLGHTTLYKYDDQMRITEQLDPWLNKKQFVYDDEKLSSYFFINGKKHKQEEKTPWSLTMKKTYFPLSDARSNTIEFIKKTDAFGRMISQESALVDMQSSTRYAVRKNSYEYDSGHNRIKIVTQSDDGLSLTKEIKYDLFSNQYSMEKKQDNNGRLNTHFGYRYVYDTDNKLERVISPEFGDHQYFVTKHRYDKNGREIEREFSDGKIIRNQYTPRGLLKTSSWNRNGKVFQVRNYYNADGQLIKETDSEGQEQHYQYNLKGNLTRRIYPDKQQQDYEYDQYNRLVLQKNVGNRILTYHYDDKDKGLLSAIKSDAHEIRFTYGTNDNGAQGSLLAVERDIAGTDKTKEVFTYGPYGRIIASTITTAAAISKDGLSVEPDKRLLSRQYEFLPRGELIRQTTHSLNADNQPVTNSHTYSYDGLKRLIKEQHWQKENNKPVKAANREISYQYDGNNNLIAEQRTEGGATQIIHRHYNEVDQLKKIKQELSGEEFSIVYDKNGRITTDHQGNKYDYDDRGVLLTVSDTKDKTLVQYFYWPDGLLSHTTDKEKSQQFYYHQNGQVQTVKKDNKLHDYIRYGNSFLGTLTACGGEHLFTSNHSTGARLWMDERGKQALNVFKYEGYGQTQNPVDEKSGSSTDFLWNQEFHDKKTGLVYLRHRFYHPELRRFIKRDNQKIDNLYTYAAANPIEFVDPMGHAANRGLNYALGTLLAALSLTIGILASPETGGASLSLTSLNSVGVAGAAGGLTALTTMASQLAFDLGCKTLGSIFRLESYVVEAAYSIAGVAALASLIGKGTALLSTEFTEEEAIEMTAVRSISEASPTTSQPQSQLRIGEANVVVKEEEEEPDILIFQTGKVVQMTSTRRIVSQLTHSEMQLLIDDGYFGAPGKLEKIVVRFGGKQLNNNLNSEGDNWLTDRFSMLTQALNSSKEYAYGFFNKMASSAADFFGYSDADAPLSTPGASINTAGEISKTSSNITADQAFAHAALSWSVGFWQ